MIKRAVRSLPTPFLLSTKLQRPQPAAAEAPRPRVLERLAPGLRGSLVLVSAPAGYGKTTAVNHWLDTLDLPIAWVSLDERDGDLATFVGYLLAAVRAMHARASAWFAAQGLVDEAVIHALQAGDVEGAATLVEDNVHPAWTARPGDWSSVGSSCCPRRH